MPITQHGRARGRGQRINQKSHFGDMGGLVPRTNASLLTNHAYRENHATTKLVIPSEPWEGLVYMKGGNPLGKNLLSVNPACSGGVGRMIPNIPCCSAGTAMEGYNNPDAADLATAEHHKYAMIAAGHANLLGSGLLGTDNTTLYDGYRGSSAVAVGTDIYICGGDNSNGTMSSSCYKFDTKTASWTLKAPMKAARANFGLIYASDSKIYAVAGAAMPTYKQATDGSFHTIFVEGPSSYETYDISGNNWSELGALSSPNDNYYRFTWNSFFSINESKGKLYINGGIGGYSLGTSVIVSAAASQVYDINNPGWEWNNSIVPGSMGSKGTTWPSSHASVSSSGQQGVLNNWGAETIILPHSDQGPTSSTIIQIGGSPLGLNTLELPVHDASTHIYYFNQLNIPIPKDETQGLTLTYDRSVLQWAQVVMKHQRFDFGLAVTDDTYYVAGGYKHFVVPTSLSLNKAVVGILEAINNVEAFVKTPTSPYGEWIDLPPMQQARGGFSLLLIENKLYAVGGLSVANPDYSIEYLDLGDTASGWKYVNNVALGDTQSPSQVKITLTFKDPVLANWTAEILYPNIGVNPPKSTSDLLSSCDSAGAVLVESTACGGGAGPKLTIFENNNPVALPDIYKWYVGVQGTTLFWYAGDQYAVNEYFRVILDDNYTVANVLICSGSPVGCLSAVTAAAGGMPSDLGNGYAADIVFST